MRAHHKQSFPLSSHKFDVRHLRAFPMLAFHRLVGFASSTIVGLFFPIFLYEFLGMNLPLLFLWFAIGMAMRIPLFIFAAKIFSRTGLNAAMMVGVFMWMLYYLGAYVLDVAPGFYPSLVLFGAFLALSLCHAFYWSPFHVDFATFSKRERRGRQIGLLHALQTLLSVAGPIVGGLLISLYSYDVAFLAGMVIALVSIIPIAFLPNTKVLYEFGFVETFRKMAQKKYRFLTLSMFAMGVEDMVAFCVWPVFLFIVFSGNYLEVGLFSGMIIFIGVLLQMFMGALTDKKRPAKLLTFGVDLYALGWFAKAFVNSVTGVFAASTFHTLGSIMMRTPLDTMMYEKAADSGHYVDEFTTIREIALSFGRLAILVLMIFASQYFSLSVAFLLAGLSSLAITLIARVKVGEELEKI